MIKRYLRAQIPLFSDQVALYCFFLFIIWDQGGDFGDELALLYFLAGAVAAFANVLGSQKERTLQWVVSLNVITVLLCMTLVFLAGTVRGGLVLLFITAMICIYPSCRSLYLMYHPVTTQTMLSYSELSILGISFFLVIQIGDFEPGSAANFFCIVSLILNICLLSLLRMEEKTLIRGKTAAVGSFQRNLIMLLAFTLLLLITSGLSLLLFPSVRGGIVQMAVSLKNGVLAVFQQIGEWISYLLGLFPDSERQLIIPEQEQQVNFEEYAEEMELIPQAWFYAVGAVMLLAVLSVTMFFYLKWRKNKIGSVRPDAVLSVERYKAPSLWQIFLSRCRKMVAAIQDQLRFLRCYNSPIGVFLRLEHAAKRKGIPRKKGQTSREFLLVLAEKAEEQVTIPEKKETLSLFLGLADEVDAFCFGRPEENEAAKAVCPRMDRKKIRAMISAVNAFKTKEKNRQRKEKKPVSAG